MMVDLTGRVAVVTGAGGGLGRLHALLLARLGARVVVNDLGDGAHAVAEEIRAVGGIARGLSCSVTDPEAVEAAVSDILAEWSRIDILVNNAGILRDKSFGNLSLNDFRAVLDVHFMGSVIWTKAVWNCMRQQNYGRIVMTTSSSGLYGNFAQANYGAAKMALVGLMQTLGLEGAKYDIRVNCLAPTAATAMTKGILPEDQLRHLGPEHVSPGVIALVHADAPNRAILCAGAGSLELAHITLTQGIHVLGGASAVDDVIASWADLQSRKGELVPGQGWEQSKHELTKAGLMPRNA